MKITKRQLRRIIKEAMVDEPIRMVPGDSFSVSSSSGQRKPYTKSSADTYSDVIVMSPHGDSLLVGGSETYLENVVKELEVQTGQSIPVPTAGAINAELLKQMGQGYVELPISYTPKHGWRF